MRPEGIVASRKEDRGAAAREVVGEECRVSEQTAGRHGDFLSYIDLKFLYYGTYGRSCFFFAVRDDAVVFARIEAKASSLRVDSVNLISQASTSSHSSDDHARQGLKIQDGYR